MNSTIKIILGGLFLLISFISKAQINIQNKGEYLLINDSTKIIRGGIIKINKPYQYDFIAIQQQQGFSLKKVMQIANVASVGGALGTSIGGITKSTEIIVTGAKVVNHAHNVNNIIWTAEQIGQLNASSKAKKIVGKDFVVVDWDFDQDENTFFLVGKIESKKYKIFLQNAIALNEINL
ncbi:hypothetical protein NZD88_20810 [Chryseobacterium antibioticum]|uniref:Uncharacterized protein n=1 Tax=Chryseobacterium pyrolae TaxID=2987481 RepID=A0ABT2IN53_9FLAO|nr:hypothetical protein [Chryseobacterium pyrolae]MCT2410004.1 hypothetical protein [Chryseobacterium pyrolae]